jgi:hypothetical protein
MEASSQRLAAIAFSARTAASPQLSASLICKASELAHQVMDRLHPCSVLCFSLLAMYFCSENMSLSRHYSVVSYSLLFALYEESLPWQAQLIMLDDMNPQVTLPTRLSARCEELFSNNSINVTLWPRLFWWPMLWQLPQELQNQLETLFTRLPSILINAKAVLLADPKDLFHSSADNEKLRENFQLQLGSIVSSDYDFIVQQHVKLLDLWDKPAVQGTIVQLYGLLEINCIHSYTAWLAGDLKEAERSASQACSLCKHDGMMMPAVASYMLRLMTVYAFCTSNEAVLAELQLSLSKLANIYALAFDSKTMADYLMQRLRSDVKVCFKQ